MMRFYLVDRIMEVRPRERLTARKLVSALDPIVENHPAAGPCLPPTLVVESLAQSSAWLVMVTTNFAQRGVLGSFRTITVGHPARLGERLDLVTEVEGWSGDAVMFSWRACTGGGDLVVQVEGALCLLIDTEKLEDPAYTRQLFAALQWEADTPEPAALPLGAGAVASSPPAAPWLPYDVRLPAEAGQAAALRSISMMDPVFETHFPRFPTVPGVLLMQSLVHLSRDLLQESAPGTRWEAASLKGSRFQRYIRPGDQLLLNARITELGEREATVTAEASVGGQRAMAIRQLQLVAQGTPG